MARDSFSVSDVGPGTTTFSLLGGKYGFLAVGTWGGGSIAFNALAVNGAVAPVTTTLMANGYASVDLPPGEYEFVITTATAVYASVTGIPTA